MTLDRNETLLWGIVVIATIVLAGVSFFNAIYSLPLLVVFGVIDLLAVLTIAGRVFMKSSLACKDEALGLPAGSVRALIALSLIIIFAIMAIYMYNQLTPNAVFLPANNTVTYPNGTTLLNPNDAYIIMEPSQAQRDFSSQTLTTVSTLVVALAGFYFGTKAVATAKGEKSEETEYSLTINPEGGVTYEKDKPLKIKVNTEPEGEVFKAKVDGDKKESLVIGESSDEYVYSPIARTKNIVDITFALKEKPEVTKKLSVTVEKLDITVKPENAKINQDQQLEIEVKTVPENGKVVAKVYGDLETALTEQKGKLTYSPSPKGKGRLSDSVILSFEYGTPKIVKQVTVEIADKT
jgi:hypothetical protein